MFKQVIRLSVVSAILLLLALPASISAANSKAYSEGIHVNFTEPHHNSLTGEVTATKHVDGDWRESEIHIQYDYAYVDGQRHINATVVLDGDPDQLEVSKDLGWGGLDGVVWVQESRIDCNQSSTPSCGAEYTETVPVEIHLALFANASYSASGTNFDRPATVSGTISLGDQNLELTAGHGYLAAGSNFSERYPG